VIRPEISSKTSDIQTPKGANIPQVNTTFVETTAMVPDGHTVIIGGLKQLQNTQKVTGFRPFMNVPIIGKLFRSESEKLTNTEIVLFLTPTIIHGKKNVTDQDWMIRGNKKYKGLGSKSSS